MSYKMYQKLPNETYQVFGSHTETDASFTFEGKGIVIAKSTNEVSVFGGATKIVSKTRSIMLSLIPPPGFGDLTATSSAPTVNGEIISNEIWEWSKPINTTGAFSFFSKKGLLLEANNAGFVVYQSINELILINFHISTSTVPYGSKIEKGYTRIWYNGTSYKPNSELFNITIGKNRDIISLKDDMPQTEQFYIEYPNSVNVDFTLEKINIPIVEYSGDEKPDISIILQHYMCEIVGSTETSVSIKRSTGILDTINLKYSKVSDTVIKTRSIVLYAYHKLQTISYDYSKYTDIVPGSSVLVAPQVIKSGVDNIFTINLTDGTTFFSKIQVSLVEYTEEIVKPLHLFDASFPIGTFRTECCYMVNGAIVDLGSDSINGVPVEIKFSRDVKNFSTYSYNVSTQMGEWRTQICMVRPKFDEEYEYCVFDKKNSGTTFPAGTINLHDFGVSGDNVKFFRLIDGVEKPKEIKKGLFALDMKDKLRAGDDLGTIKFMAKVEDLYEFTFDVSFVFETFSRVRYYMPEDPNFSDNSSSTGARTFDGQFSFGNFMSKIGKTINAYGVEIGSDNSPRPAFLGKDTKLFPVITYDADNIATISSCKNTYPIETFMISDKMTFTRVSDDFARLNNCDNMVITSQDISVSKTTGVCFFLLNGKLHLLKSAMSKQLSFNLGTNSGTSSTANTPRDDSLAPSLKASPKASSLVVAPPAPAPVSKAVRIVAQSVQQPKQVPVSANPASVSGTSITRLSNVPSVVSAPVVSMAPKVVVVPRVVSAPVSNGVVIFSKMPHLDVSHPKIFHS